MAKGIEIWQSELSPDISKKLLAAKALLSLPQKPHKPPLSTFHPASIVMLFLITAERNTKIASGVPSVVLLTQCC